MKGRPAAQVGNLPYRRFPIGRSPARADFPWLRRLETCDTADWKSALPIRAMGRRLAAPSAAPTPVFRRFAQSSFDRIMDYVTTTPLVLLVVPDPVIERFGLPKTRSDTVQNPVCSGGGVLFPALQNLADGVIGHRPEDSMRVVRHHHPGVEPVPLVNEESNGSGNQLRQIRALAVRTRRHLCPNTARSGGRNPAQWFPRCLPWTLAAGTSVLFPSVGVVGLFRRAA